MLCQLRDPNIHLSVRSNLSQLNPFCILIIYFLSVRVLCAPIYPKCYIGTMRNVLKILISKRKRKIPLQRPRNRWEVQQKIKVDALLNIWLYYSAMKMEAERSFETFVPAQKTTWHTSNINVRHRAVFCYCIAKNKVSETHFVISKFIFIIWCHYVFQLIISPCSDEANA